MTQIRVGVLRGGPSSEYDVSLATGKSVLAALAEHPDYMPVDVFVDKNGVWHLYGMPADPIDIHTHVDVVFNAMHGEYGEDGTVQQLLESARMPYTGAGVMASALAMHKARAKDYFKREGILVAPSAVFSIERDTPETLRDIFRSIPGPYIVKPVASGSSVGVRMAHSFADLHDAVYEIALTFPDVLIEKMIKGREVTCGVIEGFRGEELYALLPVEIVPPNTSAFFDYDAKYSGESAEICPGRFSRDETRALQEHAKRAHRALGLRDYSRSDFIVTPRGIYILETNALPGLTPSSLLPKSLHAVGASIADFLHHAIDRAHRRR